MTSLHDILRPAPPPPDPRLVSALAGMHARRVLAAMDAASLRFPDFAFSAAVAGPAIEITAVDRGPSGAVASALVASGLAADRIAAIVQSLPRAAADLVRDTPRRPHRRTRPDA